MSKFVIEGGGRLDGSLRVQGAKNSALPILAATLIGAGESVIHNCPMLSDVDAAVRILSQLGCKTSREGNTVRVDSSALTCDAIPDDLMREMRSSCIFMGAILARCGSARLSFPGGCELGPRPIDLHLSSLRQLGAVIEESHGYLDCRVERGLRGCEISLPIPSVGATENIMLAACAAEGTTLVRNAAREPEISDLAAYLNACGGRISGAGESTLRIEGGQRFHGAEHRVIPDRIVAATYLAAAAVTGGSLELRDVCLSHLEPVLPSFWEAGCALDCREDNIRITGPERLQAVKTVRTMAYPGFPTDAQPPVMAMTLTAQGTSMFVENIFENRYKHAGEMLRMGAQIKVEGKVAVVEGVRRLTGAPVMAGDLRGGAALVVAALGAEGVTEVGGVRHIDRGYEDMPQVLLPLGASIRRVEEG